MPVPVPAFCARGREQPAIFSLLQHLEVTEGVWYPVGGFQRIMNALASRVRELGVTIDTDQAVDHILVDEASQRAVGVVLTSGKVVKADVVVSNVDLPTAYSRLLPGREARAQKLASLQFSSGVVAFYWCVRRRVDELAHHTTFISPGGEEAWDTVFAGHAQVPDEPSFYVCCPAKTDPSAAPAGGESVMVLVPVGRFVCVVDDHAPRLCIRTQCRCHILMCDQNCNTCAGCMPEDADVADQYTLVAARARAAVLERLKRVGVDLEGDIMHEVIYTPQEWRQRYGLFRGAAFGLAHPLSQLVIFRPPNRDDSVRNIYFVGASTTPGNGVPLVFTGARMCAERILAENV